MIAYHSICEAGPIRRLSLSTPTIFPNCTLSNTANPHPSPFKFYFTSQSKTTSEQLSLPNMKIISCTMSTLVLKIFIQWFLLLTICLFVSWHTLLIYTVTLNRRRGSGAEGYFLILKVTKSLLKLWNSDFSFFSWWEFYPLTIASIYFSSTVVYRLSAILTSPPISRPADNRVGKDGNGSGKNQRKFRTLKRQTQLMNSQSF